jgi:hypothetical protein
LAARLVLPCAVLVTSGCLGPSRVVSLARLTADQTAYQGKAVVVHGTIVAFNDGGGRYFVIQDSHEDRVESLPASWIAPYAGRRVTVDGTFHVDLAIGRWIRLRSVSPAIHSPARLAGRDTARPAPGLQP